MSQSSEDLFIAELRTFAGGAEPPSDRDSATIDAAFILFEAEETASRPRRALWRATAAAATLAAAAAVVLALLPPEADRAAGEGQQGTAPLTASLGQEALEARLRTGELLDEARDRPVAIGDAVPEGVPLVAKAEDTCVDVAAGEMCFDHDTRFALDLSQPRLATIGLDRGRTRVKTPGQDGRSMRVSTKHGQIETEAGEFSVEDREYTQVVVIAVLAGGVTYTSNDGVQSEIAVGESVEVGEPTHVDLEIDESDSPTGSRRASAKALLERAQSERAAGKLGRTAVTYDELARAYPNTSEGRRAMLSLGELELTRRGRPRVALRWLDRYLQSGDDLLAEEARFLRIRALRELGRTSEERAATMAFIKRYPRSPYTARLKERLRALGED